MSYDGMINAQKFRESTYSKSGYQLWKLWDMFLVFGMNYDVMMYSQFFLSKVMFEIGFLCWKLLHIFLIVVLILSYDVMIWHNV